MPIETVKINRTHELSHNPSLAVANRLPVAQIFMDDMGSRIVAANMADNCDPEDITQYNTGFYSVVIYTEVSGHVKEGQYIPENRDYHQAFLMMSLSDIMGLIRQLEGFWGTPNAISFSYNGMKEELDSRWLRLLEAQAV